MQSIFITGASTGIGHATALDLDRRGFRVFATVRREEDGEALAARASSRLCVLLLDVTDTDAIGRAAAAVEAAVGEAGLDGLVNNAGVVEPGPIEFVPLDSLRRQMEVNVTGQVAVTQAFLPLLRRARGRIVNVGSVGGLNVLPFAGAYCASKFALEAVTDALRMELKAWDIDVVIVEPGSVATPIWTKGAGKMLPEEAEALYGAGIRAMKAAVETTASQGISPDVVARVIHQALTARRPRTRYLVGRMAYVRVLVQKLPDRLRDRLLLRRLTKA
jgi:NAD(P)-dependent dehydrogenase (short-subunit alcohol dehydrogenase family)